MFRSIFASMVLMPALAVAYSGAAAAEHGAGPASAVCERAASPRYTLDPLDADACWDAIEAAVGAHQFERALAMAKLGCEKHRRADFCVFIERLNETPRGVMALTGTRHERSGPYIGAIYLVTPHDVEDAETGLYRQLRREADRVKTPLRRLAKR
jgi:hypothetical protein